MTEIGGGKAITMRVIHFLAGLSLSVGLNILLLVQPVWVAAGVPGDQVRQTTDKLLAVLKDPQLKGESKKNERRDKLKELTSIRQ